MRHLWRVGEHSDEAMCFIFQFLPDVWSEGHRCEKASLLRDQIHFPEIRISSKLNTRLTSLPCIYSLWSISFHFDHFSPIYDLYQTSRSICEHLLRMMMMLVKGIHQRVGGIYTLRSWHARGSRSMSNCQFSYEWNHNTSFLCLEVKYTRDFGAITLLPSSQTIDFWYDLGRSEQILCPIRFQKIKEKEV